LGSLGQLEGKPFGKRIGDAHILGRHETLNGCVDRGNSIT